MSIQNLRTPLIKKMKFSLLYRILEIPDSNFGQKQAVLTGYFYTFISSSNQVSVCDTATT